MPQEVQKKIIWAVDAFEGDTQSLVHVAEVIKRLQRIWQAAVQPVHILSPSELNLSAEYVGPWVGQYMPSAERALARLITELKLENIEPPEILTHSSASTARAVDLLVDAAQRMGAELILVGSHGRTGMGRLLLGSFAETLLSRSSVPVLVVGPHFREDIDFGQILSPTDFREQAKKTFKTVVGFAHGIGARVVLYHAIPKPAALIYESGVYLMGGPWIPVQEYYNRELLRQERRLKSWADWAKHQGVETDPVMDSESENIAESILAQARKRKVGWIAMASHSGPIASALLGSVARKVVRGAECPVWVIRPRPESAQLSPRRAA